MRHSDWDGVESGAKAFLAYLEREGSPKLEARRAELGAQIARLGELGISVEPAIPAVLEESGTLQKEGRWREAVDRVLAATEGIRQAAAQFAAKLEEEVRALAAWAAEKPDSLRVALAKLKAPLGAIQQGQLEGSLAELHATIEHELPAAAARRAAARATAEGIASVAQDLGVPAQEISAGLEADAKIPLLNCRESVAELDRLCEQVSGSVRERVLVTVESYRATVTSLREHGIDPEPVNARLEECVGKIQEAAAADLPKLLVEAREVVEEPVVTVVAGMLDEVRPKLVEARRLGRNPSEVFQAMNRAREALRLKIYGEALAASQEALEQVSRITEDLDSARDEAQALDDLLGQLAAAQFPVGEYEAPLAEVRTMLDRMELERAEGRLRATVRRIGEQAMGYFAQRIAELERTGQQCGELGFLPKETPEHLAEARRLLAEAEIGPAAEATSRIAVELRGAAEPYFSTRLEEVGKSLGEIPDASLTDPVRRLLADADVSLRVKEDLPAALETLRRAEREFSVVFAQHASALVEGLEEERRILEEMGGTGEETQRQIDEVQEIFNMGDFVKAFRAAQEIRTRARQQQLVRSEEAISHAKLALVELGKLGLDTIALRASLEKSQESSRGGQFPEAYRAAQQVLDSAQRLRTTAQASLDRIREVTELWETLQQSGVAVQPYVEQLHQARAACEGLDFERARQLTDTLHEQLDLELARYEAARLIDEADALSQDGDRLGLPVASFRSRIQEIKGALVHGGSRELWNRARGIHQELVGLLRPVLEENVRSLERDVEVARAGELNVSATVSLIAEVRRRLSLPVPLGVAEVLDRARGQFFETRGFLEHAQRVARRAREALDRAEIVRVDVRPFRSRVEKVERHVAERDYARAIDLASTLERELSQAAQHQVSKTLAGFQGMLTRARREGAQTTLAENLLEQARRSLEKGDVLDALQVAARSEGELERVELQVVIAQGSFETIERRLHSAARDGLSAPEVDRLLGQARTALTTHDYPRVLEFAIAASEALSMATEAEHRAREAVESAERQVREAGEMDAELAEVLPILERARASLASGAYEDSFRGSREAAEAARWAIERLYAGPLAELQEMIELVRSTATEGDVTPVRVTRDEAEAAVKIREWRHADEALTRGREAAYEALDRVVEAALRGLDAVYGIFPESTGKDESEQRAQLSRSVAEHRGQRDYLGALELLREEESRARERLRQELGLRVAALQDRLWVGEKLGIDTTPVMELFSEAKLAMESGKLEPVAGLVQRGLTNLEVLVRRRIEEKLREVETELIFARDGLHVTLGPVPARLEEARKGLLAGTPVDAARAVLESEEELNRRKALHRELMNLQFLVDAALGRASERHLDTAPARALLAESVKLRAQDYPPALEKAREALRLLQEALHKVDPSGTTPLLRTRGFEGI